MKEFLLLSLMVFVSVMSQAQVVNTWGDDIPGDSIGFTYYDYLTHGSPYRNLINSEDGTLAFARFGSTDSISRGSYFSCSTDHGYTWEPLTLIDPTIAAFSTGIDVFEAAGSTEIVLSRGRSEIRVYVDAAQCADVWTEGFVQTNYISPRHGVSDLFDIHLMMLDPDLVRLVYWHSGDLGLTWDIIDYPLFTNPHIPEPDAYDIAVNGSYVAAVSAGAGGDVVLARSTDYGATWEEQVIYDATWPDTLSLGEEEWVPDGACAVVIDNAGNSHVVWSNYMGVGTSLGTELRPSIDAGLLYWNNSVGWSEIALPEQNTTIDPPIGRDGNFLSQPDIGVDESGNPFVVYVQLVEERDDSLNNYQRLYGICSYDGGGTWVEPSQIGYGGGYDASYPSLAERIDRGAGLVYAHMVYNTDVYAGNAISGNHPSIPVAVRYLSFGYIDISADSENRFPVEFSLDQNYPNPFNPSTTIRFQLPRSGGVSLKIFNLLGEEVATMISGHRDAGTHTVQWDASGQPSGVYFYRLRAGEVGETRKLVLVR